MFNAVEKKKYPKFYIFTYVAFFIFLIIIMGIVTEMSTVNGIIYGILVYPFAMFLLFHFVQDYPAVLKQSRELNIENTHLWVWRPQLLILATEFKLHTESKDSNNKMTISGLLDKRYDSYKSSTIPLDRIIYKRCETFSLEVSDEPVVSYKDDVQMLTEYVLMCYFIEKGYYFAIEKVKDIYDLYDTLDKATLLNTIRLELLRVGFIKGNTQNDIK